MLSKPKVKISSQIPSSSSRVVSWINKNDSCEQDSLGQESKKQFLDTEEMLTKKQDFLEKKIQQEAKTARENASSNKRIALQALRRKKHHEKQIQHIDGVLQTIDYQRYCFMKSTEAKADMDVDQVQELMDDIAEELDVAKQINESFSNLIGVGNDIDDIEVLAELEDLKKETINEKRNTVDPTPQGHISYSLPDAPKDTTPIRQMPQKDH